MLDQIEDLRARIEAETLDSEEAAEAYRIKYLGQRSGLVTNLAKQMRDVPPEERPAVGKALNALKQLAEGRLEAAREQFQANGRQQHMAIDLSLPGRRAFTGSAHPLTQTLQDITRFFERYGFSVKTGPEIEDDWHNFTALNFPPDHPARDMQDTFFLEEPSEQANGVVLRTHTSPVQIRTLQQEPPPVRIIAPGRVYRNEAISFKSFCLFHQVEGLYVDEGVTMGDLKQILHAFARAMFGDDVQMRFRPSFFPFTEPSAEVDIWWADPSLPDGGRWLEILGCGMVDPNVLEACGVDAETYTGYAFGMGIERIAMLRYDINDIRILYENDIRFLEQF